VNDVLDSAGDEIINADDLVATRYQKID
jgi:hypothetical protein